MTNAEAQLDDPRPHDLLTVAEVARALRLDPYTVRRYIGRGHLPAYRLGRELRIDPRVLAAFLDGRRVEP